MGPMSALPHPLSSEVNTLYGKLQGMDGPVAENIRRRVPDVWLLGDAGLRQMFGLLRQAQQALSGGNEGLADQKLKEAVQLFEGEQAFHARLLETYVIPVARGTVKEARDSALPTGQELQSAEARLSKRAGSYYNIPIRDELRERIVVDRLQNGKEDIEAAFQLRLDAATQLLKKTGRISYDMVSDLYSAVTNDASAFHTLLGLWEDARSLGIDTCGDPDKVYQSFSAAMGVFVSPEYNPFSTYTKDQQDRLVRDFLDLGPDAAIGADQRRRAAGAISQQLQRNILLRYDWHVNYPAFETVVSMRAPAAGQPIRQLSSIRSIRISLQHEYEPYVLGKSPKIPGMTHDQVLNLSAPQLAQQRLRLARDYLQLTTQALTASGMDASDPLIASANAWLRANPPAADRMVKTADMLYNLTMSMISIREAEMWGANPSFRPSSLPAGSVHRATAMVQEARRAFQWNFSRPMVGPAFHSNVPRSIADEAIRVLVPRSFLDLEASGMHFTKGGYLNPSLPIYGATVADAENPTRQEHMAGASGGEQGFLSYVISKRDSPNFTPSVAETALARNGMGTSMNALSFVVGRKPYFAPWQVPLLPWGQGVDPYFQTYDSPIRRWRPTVNPVDANMTPASNPLNRNLGYICHEETDQYVIGQLYVELYRLAMIHQDSGTPEALRLMNVAPDSSRIRAGTPFEAQDRRLKARFQAIAREYGLQAGRPLLGSLRDSMNGLSARYSSGEPGAQLQGSNRLLLAVLDLRIAELDVRLAGRVVADDGKAYDVTEIEKRATSPAVYRITRAREMLEAATRIRDSLSSNSKRDMLSGQVTVRQAIAIAEMGIASVSHDTMPRPD